MRIRRWCGALVLGLSGLPISAAGARAQDQTMSLLGGPTHHTLSTTDQSGYVVALRVGFPAGIRFVRLEGSATYLRFTSEQGDGVPLLIPELAATAGIQLGFVRPYLGFGGGYASAFSGRGSSLGTLFGMGGLTVSIGRGYGIRGEAKYRSLDPFRMHSFDLVIGINKVFDGY